MSYKVIEIFVDGKVICHKNEQGASFVNDAPCLWDIMFFERDYLRGIFSFCPAWIAEPLMPLAFCMSAIVTPRYLRAILESVSPLFTV